MTTHNTPTCILESMEKVGIEIFHPLTREQAIARMREAVAACEQHKLAATLKALEIVRGLRSHEGKT